MSREQNYWSIVDASRMCSELSRRVLGKRRQKKGGEQASRVNYDVLDDVKNE